MSITVKTLKILEENPDYLEILDNIIRFEEENREKQHYIGFENHEVFASPQTLNKLVYKGILKVTLKTANFTHYRPVNLEELKRAVEIF
ncbi:MAG: hypothetical protein ACTSV7_03160, partial [Candidatus Baldrarchaeia archaeon]